MVKPSERRTMRIFTVRDLEHGMKAMHSLTKDIYLYYLRTNSLVYEYDTETGKRYAVDFEDELVEGLSGELLEKFFREKMHGEAN